MKIEKFNDVLALALMVAIVPGIWVLQGLEVIGLPGEVTGATISIWTLVAQHYFRKRKPERG